jgi:hypothetical protein
LSAVRVVRNLSIFENRTSTWFSRSSNAHLGARHRVRAAR